MTISRALIDLLDKVLSRLHQDKSAALSAIPRLLKAIEDFESYLEEALSVAVEG